MSAHFQAQIKLAFEEAEEILDDPKYFPVPVQPHGQSESAYVRIVKALIKTLDEKANDTNSMLSELNGPSDRWMSLRSSMTAAERAVDTPLYDTFVAETPYLKSISSLRKYARTLRDQRSGLEAVLPRHTTQPNPNSNPSSSLIHLPKTDLPVFSGDCTTYTSFWNTFKAGVHDLNIPESLKFTYLKQCLSGPPLTLINSLPVTDDSYVAAVGLLSQHYDNPEEVARALHNSLRKLPRVHGGESFCDDLRSLIDQLECICIHMSQQNHSYDTVSVQMEVEERLPRFVLDEIFLAKEGDDDWSTDKLKLRLRAILKRKEQIQILLPKVTTPNKTKFLNPNSPKPHSPFNSQHSSLTFHTQNKNFNPQKHPNSNFNPRMNSTPNFSNQNSRSKPKPNLPCLFCEKEGHFSARCEIFTDLSSRLERLNFLNRCHKCMKSGHLSRQCPNPAQCSNCHGPHPRALCDNPFKPTNRSTNYAHSQPQSHSQSIYPTNNEVDPNTSVPISMPNPNPLNNFPINQRVQLDNPLPTFSFESVEKTQTNTTISTNHPKKNLPVLLKCVKAPIFHPNNPQNSIEYIILLDDASNHTYIRTDEAKKLNLPLIPNPLMLGVFNSPKCQMVPAHLTQFGIKLIDGRSIIVNANAIDQLTQPTHYLPFSRELFSSCEILDQISTTCPAILLGADYYYELEPTPVQRISSGYHLVQTLLGTIVAGKPHPNTQLPQNHLINFCTQSEIIPSDFFTLESIGIKENPEPLKCDDLILTQFEEKIEIFNGRYQVQLPFRSDPKTIALPSNFGLCMGRLRSVFNTLSKNPTLLKKYNDIIQEQRTLGIIEPVPISSKFSPPLHYLAHHPVVNELKGKVRIVYDGSAHVGKEPSLNDCLYPGPILIPDLVGLLLRFRIPKFIITCDIEKAFLQVLVHPNHRDCTRFLWLKNTQLPPSSLNLQMFRFTRVSFGLTCSPFLLAATIRFHLHINPSPLSDEILSNIYVDNILLSSETETEGVNKSLAAISLFEKAGMPLREFVSNSNEIISKIPENFVLHGPDQKFLGINWNPLSDRLVFKLANLPNSPLSKRSILSFVASNYDPLGLISPVILPFKIFLQSLNENNQNWDDPLPEIYNLKWNKIIEKSTSHIESSHIPRCPITLPLTNRTYQLHCFVDASQLAMCAAVYLRVHHPSTPISQPFLIFSKTKVKPLQKGNRLTIPKLELIAVEIGTKLLKFTKSHLTNIELDSIVHLWSDSAIVISWLNNPSSIREVFVINRLKTINSLPNLIVHHVPGQQNPADIGSRGCPSISCLKNSKIWWSGPEWLSKTQEEWATNPEINPFISNKIINENPSLSNGTVMFTFHVNDIQPSTLLFDLNRFSRLPKAIRSISYFLRFISLINPKSDHNKLRYPSLTIKIAEMRSAFKFIIKQEQKAFPPAQPENEALGIFQDKNQLLRSKGRINNSQISPLSTNPIYLPPKSPLTRLIVYEIHRTNLHSSPLSTLSFLRTQFWLPKGRRTVEQIISKTCTVCRRFSAKPFDLPPVPQLPKERVILNRPFFSTGLDFCGPLHVKSISPISSRKNARIESEKYWIVLWVCLCTRNISLDIVPDQSAPTFSLAFRRFIAKFGTPQTIHCDNAPTFLAIHKFTQPMYQINWVFRIPYAAWKGGHYERFVAHSSSRTVRGKTQNFPKGSHSNIPNRNRKYCQFPTNHFRFI